MKKLKPKEQEESRLQPELKMHLSKIPIIAQPHRIVPKQTSPTQNDQQGMEVQEARMSNQ